eukprot:TRINITY_DN1820_c0_g1_i1.p1 TRINITY_DN1820_c0_g1~~TRINITY_DN1820_c0_g1_i1.p1  ORF type:complete len:646 (+),score=206.72 TRINITY_DN1820_c0_g1_i1:631-2568(+)
MGIKTVAVHSVADGGSLFVKMADEAVCIGPPPVNESYLVEENIIGAIKETGAQAVHPGYGFLSENTGFVAKLEALGVKFIGPNSEAIKSMGDKIASKRVATDAKVNGIPGFDGEIESEEHCLHLANDISYPVMIKASAGGGGKGMRVSWNDTETREAYRLCKEEGKNFFGDDRLLIEKFVDSPRHVEIQLLGDKHGNAIYLNERECSIQRRNQKVIEEAPSPFLDEATRVAMGQQAVSLAKSIGYDSAGTVEFLMDSKRGFYFLEMNTRLQVEHPITECITGVDLVQQMIRTAYGHPLKIKQEDIKINGWAFESRVYAEDPFKNFGMPSIGRLHRYEEPSQLPGVRCDSGIEEGSEISMYYDPMICKLTAYGPSRDVAIERSIDALDKYVIRGVTHNIPLLRDILTEKEFRAGNLTTSYLQETYPDGFQGSRLSESDVMRLAVIGGVYYAKEAFKNQFPLNDPKEALSKRIIDSWELSVRVNGEDVQLIVSRGKDGVFRIQSGSEEFDVKDDFKFSDSYSTFDLLGESVTTQLIRKEPNGTFRLRYKGTAFNVPVLTSRAKELQAHMIEKPKMDTSKVVQSPMPGVLKSLSVVAGDMVGEGQEVCIVEAMKMQNSLKAGSTGKVKAILVSEGETVEEDQVLVEIE